MPTTTDDAAPPGSNSGATAPFDWVPADRRWAGLDRRTIAPALFVLGFALLMNMLVPAAEHAVELDDPVRAGEVMALQGGTAFDPVDGWEVVRGVREGDEPAAGAPAEAEVTDGGVSFAVTVAAFDGDAAALIDQIKETTDALDDEADLHVTGDPVAVTTDSGAEGLLVRYHSPASDGVLAAFVKDGTGVRVVATGPPDLSEAAVRDIASMLASLQLEEDSR